MIQIQDCEIIPPFFNHCQSRSCNDLDTRTHAPSLTLLLLLAGLALSFSIATLTVSPNSSFAAQDCDDDCADEDEDNHNDDDEDWWEDYGDDCREDDDDSYEVIEEILVDHDEDDGIEEIVVEAEDLSEEWEEYQDDLQEDSHEQVRESLNNERDYDEEGSVIVVTISADEILELLEKQKAEQEKPIEEIVVTEKKPKETKTETIVGQLIAIASLFTVIGSLVEEMFFAEAFDGMDCSGNTKRYSHPPEAMATVGRGQLLAAAGAYPGQFTEEKLELLASDEKWQEAMVDVQEEMEQQMRDDGYLSYETGHTMYTTGCKRL